MGIIFINPEVHGNRNSQLDPKIHDIIDKIREQSPSGIRECFEAIFKEMDSNAREAVFKTLYKCCSEKEIEDLPFQLKPGMMQEMNDVRFTERQFSLFSESGSADEAPLSRQIIEDQIMSILVQVLHRAERTNEQVNAFMRR